MTQVKSGEYKTVSGAIATVEEYDNVNRVWLGSIRYESNPESPLFCTWLGNGKEGSRVMPRLDLVTD